MSPYASRILSRAERLIRKLRREGRKADANLVLDLVVLLESRARAVEGRLRLHEITRGDEQSADRDRRGGV